MTDRIVDREGCVWVTAKGGAAELGDDVTPALIRSWASSRRALVAGRRANGRTWYRLHELQAVEAHTFGRTKARTTS